MRVTLSRLFSAALAVLVSAAAAAQSLNPDISLIGDVRAFVTDDAADPKEGELQLDLESAELAIQGYLNPFARADLFVGYHDGEFELEELYATILRGLPLGTVLRAGKYRVDFGKLNLLHPHAYSFLDTPLVHQQFLGEEGLNDIGLNLNWQVPVGDSSLTISGNLLKGDWVEPHEHDHEHAEEATATSLSRFLRGGAIRALQDEAETEAEIETALGTSERVALFVPTGEWAGVEIGVNALQGTLDDLTDRRVDLLGADVKYRWAPDKYRSLTVQGEWIRSERDVVSDHEADDGEPVIERVESTGYFAFFDWRFRQRWNLGAIVERSGLADEADVTVERAGVFAGFALMEETTMVRLLLRRSDGDEFPEPFNEAILQLVFSLGPHKAHWF
jgi:predicted outer membrane protein